MRAQDRLNAARDLAARGEYVAALDEHIWFHEHALEEQPSLSGVRLSYALRDWVDLASVYPEAGLALQAIRDRKTAALLANEAERGTFLDVAAINRYLDCAPRTYELFKALAQSRPELARSCAQMALPAVLAAGDFGLAERFMGDPRKEIAERSESLSWAIDRRKRFPFSRAPQVAIEIHLYARDIEDLLAIVKGCGRLAEARELERLAVDSVKATKIREAVAAALKAGAQRWFDAAIARHARQEFRYHFG